MMTYIQLFCTLIKCRLEERWMIRIDSERLSGNSVLSVRLDAVDAEDEDDDNDEEDDDNKDGGARSVMVIIVGNRHGDTSSNPGRS